MDAQYLFSSAGFQEIRLGPPRKGATVLYDEYYEDVARIEGCHVHQHLPNFFGAFSIHIYELSRVPFTSDEPVVGV